MNAIVTLGHRYKGRHPFKGRVLYQPRRQILIEGTVFRARDGGVQPIGARCNRGRTRRHLDPERQGAKMPLVGLEVGKLTLERYVDGA